MANPVVTDITKNTWVKVATNVYTGFIHKIETQPYYLQTYRETGDPAPTSASEGIVMFEKSLTEEISSSVGIDVYVYSNHKDTNGKIRIDL